MKKLKTYNQLFETNDLITKLNLSNQDLTELPELPETLETLDCSYNHLKELPSKLPERSTFKFRKKV